MVLFKRIGQKYSESLFNCRFVTSFSKKQIELQVSHGVGRHQDFKAVQPWYKMRFHIVAPDSLLPFKLIVDMLDNLRQKGACTGCRIEHLHFMYLYLLGGIAIF